LLVIAELLTGTFYLSCWLGAIAGALCAHFGLGTSSQIVAAALLGSVPSSSLLCCASAARELPASSNRDVNMDVGETVVVEQWNTDGTAQSAIAAPPGPSWDARAPCHSRPAPRGRSHGNRLLVDKI
jgi:membrane protein implicated in regulation of membrane protease activity